MGMTVLKNMVFALFLSLIKIPLNIVGPELISRNWVSQDDWSGLIGNLAVLGACFIWAKIETTETVQRMSGVVTIEHSDRIARVARAADPSTPLTEIKSTAEELKSISK